MPFNAPEPIAVETTVAGFGVVTLEISGTFNPTDPADALVAQRLADDGLIDLAAAAAKQTAKKSTASTEVQE